MLLHRLGAPFDDDSNERAGVYLTNALTGWEPPTEPKQHLLFTEMEEERDKAQAVKQHAPILVILGNPPYNGFAGAAMDEERDLVTAYRAVKKVAPPQGQGLNDLYVRFFRMAERRITEGVEGRGIVCFISNYSWLDGLSFTGMRERFLEAFDHIWIDCLNGDAYKTGKLTPDGDLDPSVFSTEHNREGIQIGTAVSVLCRSEGSANQTVAFREYWGRKKRLNLLESLESGKPEYSRVATVRELGLPFASGSGLAEYSRWPLLTDLMPRFLPAVKTSRDLDLVAIDAGRLEERMGKYFEAGISDTEMMQLTPSLMTTVGSFRATQVRSEMIRLGIDSGEYVSCAYRPFDTRVLYWNAKGSLLDRPRPELRESWRKATGFLVCRPHGERTREGSPFLIARGIPEHHYSRPAAACFPLLVEGQVGSLLQQGATNADWVTNASRPTLSYVEAVGLESSDSPLIDAVTSHVFAIGHSQLYLGENAAALRQDWPRIPLPATADALLASAQLGRRVAALLDVESPVDSVSSGQIRFELRPIGSIATAADGGQIDPAAGDLAVIAGWGHAGKGGICMPGKGRLTERPYTDAELAGFREGLSDLGLTYDQLMACLGGTCVDVFLNERAYWRCVPARVWHYTIGGYQVMKKWLSYRERPLLGRDLTAEEARYVTEMARRIAALLLLEPALDENYAAVKAETFEWRPSE
jgi:hypothetical protein